MEHDAAAGRTGPGAARAGIAALVVGFLLGASSPPSAWLRVRLRPRSSRAEHTPQVLEVDPGDLAVAPAGHGAPRADQGLPVFILLLRPPPPHRRARDPAAQRGSRGPRGPRRRRPRAGASAGLGQREAGRPGRGGDRRDRLALPRQPALTARDPAMTTNALIRRSWRALKLRLAGVAATKVVKKDGPHHERGDRGTERRRRRVAGAVGGAGRAGAGRWPWRSRSGCWLLPLGVHSGASLGAGAGTDSAGRVGRGRSGWA